MSVSFYRFVRWKTYVREQMQNLEKIEKFLKLAYFILKCCHSGNMTRYIYFTYVKYGLQEVNKQSDKNFFFSRLRQDIKIFIPHNDGFVIFGYKCKQIWSWATSFWSFRIFKEYAIYMFYIYTWRNYSGYWSCPTSKKDFSENSLTYMLYIWHGRCFMKSIQK